jgi:hypothetical protein
LVGAPISALVIVIESFTRLIGLCVRRYNYGYGVNINIAGERRKSAAIIVFCMSNADFTDLKRACVLLYHVFEA